MFYSLCVHLALPKEINGKRMFSLTASWYNLSFVMLISKLFPLRNCLFPFILILPAISASQLFPLTWNLSLACLNFFFSFIFDEMFAFLLFISIFRRRHEGAAQKKNRKHARKHLARKLRIFERWNIIFIRCRNFFLSSFNREAKIAMQKEFFIIENFPSYSWYSM